MTTQEFDELAGRIEGIARSVMILAGTLQRNGLLDEQKLQADLRIAGERLRLEVPNRATVVQTLEEVADQLLADFRYVKTGKRNRDQ
ncbi:hypothetical protein SAMN04490179_4516 [Pseudomonas antarctica]|uniref:Uncharacterized protein n=1 Tax=Pseudomonas antarctica TaxID=219572 RepID=A0A1H0BWB3_9PSED|nr:hypothetical protein [Pseudomonas antarctica]KAF2406679.1 hypothetical protein PSAN_48560 [Pseudomonas antarctica]SDN49857.1 hypothetical protein SAMN04490179_4516 [Pseudomonas antarctica]